MLDRVGKGAFSGSIFLTVCVGLSIIDWKTGQYVTKVEIFPLCSTSLKPPWVSDRVVVVISGRSNSVYVLDSHRRASTSDVDQVLIPQPYIRGWTLNMLEVARVQLIRKSECDDTQRTKIKSGTSFLPWHDRALPCHGSTVPCHGNAVPCHSDKVPWHNVTAFSQKDICYK